MSVADLLASIDSEISRLQQARALLAGEITTSKKRGRPAGQSIPKKASENTRSPEKTVGAI